MDEKNAKASKMEGWDAGAEVSQQPHFNETETTHACLCLGNARTYRISRAWADFFQGRGLATAFADFL